MARQAEAERERRAKIVAAEGEHQAAERLAAAAAVISATPGAMQLRQLQTMVEVSAEKNSTLMFPIPIELFEHSAGTGAFNKPAARAATPGKIEQQSAKAVQPPSQLVSSQQPPNSVSPPKQEPVDPGATINVAEPDKNKQKA
jgi:hypothetical protein